MSNYISIPLLFLFIVIVIRAMLQAKEHADEETKYVPKRTRKEILAQREKEKAQEHEI